MPISNNTSTTSSSTSNKAQAVSYRKYFETQMLDDALLKTYVTPNIVKESSEFVESFALSLGVQPAQIAVPTPYAVSRLAQLFAYMTAAFRKATFSKGGEADNDSFALKFKLYKELLDEWEKQLTADSFKDGGAVQKLRRFPMTMPLYRN